MFPTISFRRTLMLAPTQRMFNEQTNLDLFRPLRTHGPMDGARGRYGLLDTREQAPPVVHPGYRGGPVAPPLQELEFTWNGRTCHGNALHKAAADGDAGTAASLLDAGWGVGLATSRLHYVTWFNNSPQEGSGEAIHIAASRGYVKIVQLLIEHRASFGSFVTRSSKNHYDVLHAAVFAEGSGGKFETVNSLLGLKATITANSDKKWPLQLAFQTGQAKLIPLIRNAMEEQNCDLDEIENEDVQGAKTPLRIGIEMRKLSREQLAEVAAPTAQSLKIFIRHQPECIPAFLNKLRDVNKMQPAQLAQLFEPCDLPRVIKECPALAGPVLDALTAQPKVQNEGWHPLPNRISFAPRNMWHTLRDLMNSARDFDAVYAADQSWRCDPVSFAAPDWHKEWTDTPARPIRDVAIKVCHVPDLISVEFFAALCHAADDDTLEELFKNDIIRGAVELVWWHGAFKVDLVQVVANVCGLALLIWDTYAARASQSKDPLIIGVSASFVVAKAVLELGHEILQFRGLARIGQARDYFDLGNAYEVFRCALPGVLMHWECHSAVHILIIILYWLRLTEVYFSERLSLQLLPIERLARGLGPATVVATISFCTFTHAFYALASWQDDYTTPIIQHSFKVLISGDIDVIGKGALPAVLTYISVCVFTIFSLNIFIGVIGQNYTIQQNIGPLVVRNVRAQICSTYLLRASFIPQIFSERWALVLSVLAVGFALSLVIFTTVVAPISQTLLIPAFAVSQMVMVFSAYQNSGRIPWAASAGGTIAQEGSTDALGNAPDSSAEEEDSVTSPTALESGMLQARSRRLSMRSRPSSPFATADKHYVWLALVKHMDVGGHDGTPSRSVRP
uniref:Ion transport domain-containing protein n=1 Tax=Zooxanthella nutricula TaxID=1333877 RepID=A0A7S2LNI9_9DINO